MNEHIDGGDDSAAAERLADALDGTGTAAGGQPVAADDAALVALATAIVALPPLEASRRAAVDAAVGVPPAAPPWPGGDPAPSPSRPGAIGDDAATGLGRLGRVLLLVALLGGTLWTVLGPRRTGGGPAAAATDPPARATAAAQVTAVSRRATPAGLVVTRLDRASSAPDGPTAAVTGPRAMARAPARLGPAVEQSAGASIGRPTGPPATTAASVADPPDRSSATPTPVTAASPSDPSLTPPVGQAPCGTDAPVRGVDVRVVDPAGRPVADAEVAVGEAPAGALDVFAVTGADGCRHIGLGRGRYHLRVTALGESRWYRDAGDRSAADALDVGDAGLAITLTLRTAGADGLDGPPSSAAADRRDEASTTAGGRRRPSMRRAQAEARPAPLGLHQSGGAVTAVAHDLADNVVWAVVGPRVTAWRLDADGWRPIGASAVLPSVPESIAVGDGRVVVGVREHGGAALWVLDGTQPTEPPITARVPLDRSGPTTIGAVAVGGAIAWAVTDRGVSVVDLKGSVPIESGFVPTADRRTAAMDALDWQGGVAVTADRHIAVVVRPWGLWVVDAVDPYRPRVRSMPRSRPSDQAWPAFAVAARGHEAVLVDASAAGPGIARIVDVRAPDQPVVVAARDLGDATAALSAAHAHPRDDPRDGRSRGPAVAWHGDHVVFLAADGTRWAVLRRSEGLQGAATGGPLAAWGASRAAVAVAASDADPPERTTLAVAAGDAGLVGVVDGVRHAAPSIAPPIWQSVVGADGRHLLGAAGPAGLAVIDVAADGVAAHAPWAVAQAGAPCGTVLAVAAADMVDLALTADCGLVTVAIDAVGRPSVLGALPWSTQPLLTAGAQAVAFAAAAHRAAWIERPGRGEAAIVVADVRRPAQPVVVNVLATGNGVPTGLGLSADTVWAVVVDALGQATLWRWPVDVIGAAPTRWAELDRAHRVVDAAPGTLRLSWPLSGAAVAAVGTGLASAAVTSRSDSGFGRVAPATTPLGRSIWLASDGRQLDALDRASGLATTGASLDLPHGQLVDAWSTSPQRDDVHVVGLDVVVSLGDAGVVRLPDAVARIGSDEAVAGRAGPVYLPAVHAERNGGGQPRVVVLLDGTAAAARWFAANGGGVALVAAVGAWRRGLPGHTFVGATWGEWAERTGSLAPDAAAALVARIAAAPAADRRADAALALALDVLDRPGAEAGRSISGGDVVVLIAAGDTAPHTVAGAESRAHVLRSRGAALVVVSLGGHRPGSGLERIARAGGSAVRAVANAPALAAAVGGRGAAP